jgi:hypothetical protein
MSNTILLGPDGIRKERLLATGKTITPGFLLEYTTDLAVQPHSSAAGAVKPVMIAIEEPENQGHGIDDDYTEDDEIVQVDFSEPGQDRYMFLAAGETAVLGSALASAGDGTLEVSSTNKVAYALEAVDNAAGYTAVRIRVEVC